MGRVFKKGKYWYVDYVADGKRHRQKHSRDKKLARLHLGEIELQIAREELQLPTDIAIAKLFENFLSYIEQHLSPKSVERYRSVIGNFEKFRAQHGSLTMLSRVSPQILEDFKAYRLRKVTKVTINHDLKILCSIFNWSIKRNYIKKNPAKEVERFRVESKEARFFSREEIRLILENCSSHMYPIYMILLHTGVRKGELANIEWPDVDFERRVIKITPKAGWTPKGKRGREIPINDELLPVLLELKAKSKGRYVVEKTNDKPYNRGLWLNFKRLARKLGMEDANILHVPAHFRELPGHEWCRYCHGKGAAGPRGDRDDDALRAPGPKPQDRGRQQDL
jgi:integrase